MTDPETRGSLGFDRMFDSIDHGIRSAKVVLLTVNIICAFLFLMVFELTFGWQSFRPDASVYIFADRLSAIATFNLGTDNSTADSTLVWVGQETVREIITSSPPRDSLDVKPPIDSLNAMMRHKKVTAIRDLLTGYLKRDSVWLQEEHVLVFVHDLDKKKDTAKSDLRLSNPQLAFYAQEIRDRAEVINKTRDHRVEARQYNFPVIGTLVQVEDVSLPVAVFLILLSYWTYTTLMRVWDTAKGIVSHVNENIQGSTSEHLALDKATVKSFETTIISLVHRFQFMRMRKDRDKKGKPISPERHTPMPDMGVTWLFLGPFLVVLASIMSNFHETFLLDLRFHGSTYLFNSSPLRAFYVRYALLIACAVYLGRLGIKTTGTFVKTYWKIRDSYETIKSLKVTGHNTTTSNLTTAEPKHRYEAERQRILRWYTHPATLAWIAISPIVLFGTFSTLSAYRETFLYEYFLSLPRLIVYICILIGYGLGFRVILSRRYSSNWRRAVFSAAFLLLPAGLLVASLIGTCIVGGNQVWHLVPTFVSVVGIVVIGSCCGVYSLLLSGPAASGIDDWPRSKGI